MERSSEPPARRVTSASLRSEISARNLYRATDHAHEATYSNTPSILYSPGDDGLHGNFFPPSYRRILARPEWARRLDKTYTASHRVAHSTSRDRAELDCANSSDALLMNIFCHPSTMRSARLCSLLGISSDLRPDFGVRVHTPLPRNLTDRTEVDMQCGDLFVEAKLTETDFQTARRILVDRYPNFEATFDAEQLPLRNGQYRGYQVIRGVLAAVHHDARFAVIADARRADLRDEFAAVAAGVRYSSVRSRLLFLTWQEIAATVARPLQTFLATKYGIEAADSRR